MRLSHLTLANFRNFERLDSELPSGVTILLGANAQGKTNLLEAIFFLAQASSRHASNDRQLIHFRSLESARPFARIVGEIERSGEPQRIEIRIILENQRLRKEILINGLKRRTRDLAGIFTAVLFVPRDMLVVEGPPSERRRYLDQALSQTDPQYASDLLEYAKVLSQRNALLKQLKDRRSDVAELEYWDEKTADLGASILSARVRDLQDIETLAGGVHQQLTHQDDLKLDYVSSLNSSMDSTSPQFDAMPTEINWATQSHAELKAKLLQEFKRRRREEIQRGITVLGPHRDDIRFRLNDIDLRTYGSRGQNRSAMLAAKIAEVEWIYQRTGEWPVLLLDEVLAELDRQRREDMLERLARVNQAVVTSSDLDMFTPSFREQATIWEIEAGKLLKRPL